MTQSRPLGAEAAIPFIAALLFAGCAGTTTDTQSIIALSTPEVLDPEVRSAGLDDLKLPEQSPNNVKVFGQRPEFAYFVVDSVRTYFDYETNSMDAKNLERNKHIEKLRVGAGRRGGNGLIYDWSKRTEKVRPNRSIFSNTMTPTPSTYKKTRIHVTSYAIFYRPLE